MGALADGDGRRSLRRHRGHEAVRPSWAPTACQCVDTAPATATGPFRGVGRGALEKTPPRRHPGHKVGGSRRHAPGLGPLRDYVGQHRARVDATSAPRTRGWTCCSCTGRTPAAVRRDDAGAGGVVASGALLRRRVELHGAMTRCLRTGASTLQVGYHMSIGAEQETFPPARASIASWPTRARPRPLTCAHPPHHLRPRPDWRGNGVACGQPIFAPHFKANCPWRALQGDRRARGQREPVALACVLATRRSAPRGRARTRRGRRQRRRRRVALSGERAGSTRS